MPMKERRSFESIRIMWLIILVVCIVSAQGNSLQESLPRFEEYRVPLYRGAIHRPKWIHHGSTGEWRDRLEKLVDEPEINFAGKYFIAIHSCGTGCAYYTLTDLSSGRDLNLLDDFSTG